MWITRSELVLESVPRLALSEFEMLKAASYVSPAAHFPAASKFLAAGQTVPL
jgi:hypothetical protein